MFSSPTKWVGFCAFLTGTFLTIQAQTTPAPATASKPATSTKPWTPPTFTERQKDRDDMVKWIKDYYHLTDESILSAMSTVPRHEFVLKKDEASAYSDSPLPIDYGQLISQPWIVAEMTRQLELKPTSKVLEIGTGSGYQAAVLTHFTSKVYSIEIIKPLGEAAAARLRRLGYSAIQTKIGDGYYGWPDAGPFDGIIVTCAAGQIPPPLLKQLAPGGRMLIPVGQPFAMQSLMLVTKDADGTVRTQDLTPVRFVPLLQVDSSTQPAATAPK